MYLVKFLKNFNKIASILFIYLYHTKFIIIIQNRDFFPGINHEHSTSIATNTSFII